MTDIREKFRIYKELALAARVTNDTLTRLKFTLLQTELTSTLLNYISAYTVDPNTKNTKLFNEACTIRDEITALHKELVDGKPRNFVQNNGTVN